jgi:hypothetical protein
MSCSSLRTVAPTLCLPLYIKDSLKEDRGWINQLVWLLAACKPAADDTAAAAASVSASLGTTTLREDMGQCKSENRERLKKTRGKACQRKETLKNRKEERL